MNSSEHSNDSGQKNAVLPPELRGFSWGGFLGSWVWAIGNGVWIGLLGLIPCLGFFVRFALGSKGKEWAWRNKEWESLRHFETAQQRWAIVGLGLSTMSPILFFGLIFPIFGRAHEYPHKSSCQSNLKQISLGLTQYAQDYDGKCPPGTTIESWKKVLDPYIKSDSIYHCPDDSSEGISYSLNPKMAGANLAKSRKSSLIPVFFDSEPRHLDGLNVAFADGRIYHYQTSAWESEILPRISTFIPNKSPSKQ